MSRFSTLPLVAVAVAVAVILAAASSSFANAQLCQPITMPDGRTVDLNGLNGMYEYSMSLKNESNTTFFGFVDPCNNQFTNAPLTQPPSGAPWTGNAGFGIVTPWHTRMPQITFDQKLYNQNTADSITFHFASSFQPGNFLHFKISCNSSAQGQYQLANGDHSIAFKNSSTGLTLEIHVGVDRMCQGYTSHAPWTSGWTSGQPWTSAPSPPWTSGAPSPPWTSNHPWTSYPGPNPWTSAPAPTCWPFEFNGTTVQPGRWPSLYSNMLYAMHAWSFSYGSANISICADDPSKSNLVLEGFGISPGPQRRVFGAPTNFTTTDQGAVWMFVDRNETRNTSDFAYIYVGCGGSGGPDDLQFKYALVTIHQFGNASMYQLVLESPAFCGNPTTQAPDTNKRCQPFWINPTTQVTPQNSLGYAFSLLKDMSTGVSRRVLATPCNEQWATTLPANRVPGGHLGFLYISDDNDKNGWAFDVLKRAAWLEVAQEYRIHLRSDEGGSSGHAHDEAEIVIRCDPQGNRALAFQSKYYDSWSLPSGGTYYQFQMVSMSMCANPITTTNGGGTSTLPPPPPMSSSAPSPPWTSAAPSPPWTSAAPWTSGAAKKEEDKSKK